MYVNFVYPSVGGHLGGFHLLAIMSNISMSREVEIFEYLSPYFRLS